MSSSPGSTAALRVSNQSRVVRVVREAGGLSQAQIARRTQLAPATVSGIIRELVTAGFLHSEAGAGRRGATVTVSPEAGVVAARCNAPKPAASQDFSPDRGRRATARPIESTGAGMIHLMKTAYFT